MLLVNSNTAQEGGTNSISTPRFNIISIVNCIAIDDSFNARTAAAIYYTTAYPANVGEDIISPPLSRLVLVRTRSKPLVVNNAVYFQP